jgi:hypothetical protein
VLEHCLLITPKEMRCFRSIAWHLDQIWLNNKMNRVQKLEIITNCVKVISTYFQSLRSFPWTATWYKPKRFLQDTFLPRPLVPHVEFLHTSMDKEHGENIIQALNTVLSKYRWINLHTSVKVAPIISPSIVPIGTIDGAMILLRWH